MAAEGLHHATGPGLHELISAINIGVVIAIIVVAGRKGILASLKERSKDIADRLFRARNELERAKIQMEKVRNEVANLERKRAEILKEVEEEGRRISAALVEEAQHTAERIVADANAAAANEVTLATKKLQQTLVKRAAEEAFGMIAKAENGSAALKNQLHEKLIERLVNEASTNQGALR